MNISNGKYKNIFSAERKGGTGDSNKINIYFEIAIDFVLKINYL